MVDQASKAVKPRRARCTRARVRNMANRKRAQASQRRDRELLARRNAEQAAERVARMESYVRQLTEAAKARPLTTRDACALLGVREQLAREVLRYGLEACIFDRDQITGKSGGRAYVYSIPSDSRQERPPSPVERWLYGRAA